MPIIYLCYALSIFLLVLTTYILIIKPQKTLRAQITTLQYKLTPGAYITTYDNKTGIILYVDKYTVRIQENSGQITEILTQSIQHVTGA